MNDMPSFDMPMQPGNDLRRLVMVPHCFMTAPGSPSNDTPQSMSPRLDRFLPPQQYYVNQWWLLSLDEKKHFCLVAYEFALTSSLQTLDLSKEAYRLSYISIGFIDASKPIGGTPNRQLLNRASHREVLSYS